MRRSGTDAPPGRHAAHLAALVGWAVLGAAGSGLLAAPPPAAKEGQPAPAGPTQKIVAVAVAPTRATDALNEARQAIEKGNWAKAGGILEGLMDLDPKFLAEAVRRGVAANLVTCYLQVQDAAGAGRTLARRASMAAEDKERSLIVAAAEAMRESGGARIGDKAVRTYEEALAAAVDWKTRSLLAQAKRISSQEKMFSVAGRMERIAKNCMDKLAEADLYSPGFREAHRREVLEPMVAHLMEGARKTVELCTAEREYLNTHRYLSLYGSDQTKEWMGRVNAYLAARQDAEEALNNLKASAGKMPLGDLYNGGEVDGLLKKLDDLRYYPVRDPQHRLRILPRPTGG
jgi:hypothetical protein